MEGIDKLDRIVAGRSLLEWSIGAIAAAPEVESIALVTTAERIDRIVAAGWLPESVRAVVPGGERRHESVAAGLAALARLGERRTGRPGPRRCAAARHRGADRAGRIGGRRARGRGPRGGRRRDAEAD